MPVVFCQVTFGTHTDSRTTISDIILPDEVSFSIVQIRAVVLTEEAIKSKYVIGNHYHPKASGREEFFVATGPEDKELFCLPGAIQSAARSR